MNRILWEFPVTGFVCSFLVFTYIFIGIFIPPHVQYLYFFSHPGKFNPVNWFLSTFYHASPSHLFSNVFFLFFLGRAAEAKTGRGKWVLYYIIAGLVSGFGDSFVRSVLREGQGIPTVGASGAICGIAAVAGLLSPYSMVFLGKKIPFPVFLVAWFMIYSDFSNLFSNDNIAHWSHLGGYVSVFITSYLVDNREKEELKKSFLLNFVFFVLSIILLFFIQRR